MIKIAFVIGTRPEGIKMSPIILECMKHKKIFLPIVINTSQHDELIKQVLRLFDIKPKYDLGIMKSNQNLFDITSNILNKINNVFEADKPDIILVQGDTTTVLATSIAAFYMKIKLGHVEAGLRSHDKHNPFPEEINRKIASVIADFHFCPTKIAVENLKNEKITKNIFLTGNTIVDSLELMLKKKWKNNLNINFDKRIILATVHRRESFGIEFENIVKALRKIAMNHDNIEILFPVHPNPNVRKIFLKKLNNIDRIKLFEPLDYLSLINVMSRSYLILTDSGGIQEEAPYFNVPVLVLRRKTERPEGIIAGCAKLVGTSQNNIYRTATLLLESKKDYKKMIINKNPYGDGNASKRIVNILIDKFE